MKILKYFFNILFILNIFVIISCASTPKQEELPEEKVLDVLNDSNEIENTQNDTLAEDVNSEAADDKEIENTEIKVTEQNTNTEEENGISSNETSLNEYSSLEEKIEEDILPELPPLEEEQLETQIDNDISTPSIQEEPQIQQTNNQNEIKDNNSEQTKETDNLTTEDSNIETNKSDTTESTESSVSAPTSELEDNSNDKTVENTQTTIIQDETNETANTDNENINTEQTNEDFQNTANSQLEETNQIEESLEDDTTENEIVNKKIKPSRSMTIKKNQYIDITYPGTGWIYLGQKDNKKDFTFFGRKLGGKDTSFTLRAKNPGTYLLHFYKNDPLTNSYIDDYLEVIVENKETSSTEHILAPNYATIVPPKVTITAETRKENKKQNINKTVDENKNKQQKTQEEQTQNVASKKPIDSSVKTVIQTQDAENTNEISETSNTQNIIETKQEENNTQNKPNQNLDKLKESELLALAKKQFANKEHSNALFTLEKFFEKAVSKIDEGLFLQGQILESKSDVQNIKGAIDSYELIVKSYPASAYWTQANKRTIFLKRFYINIR
ncbi:MAG: hypothetical protein U0K92_02000 [Treponema sp.]|nr:hypothetical protein [Treponema sp.]